MEAEEGVVTAFYSIMPYCRSGRGPQGHLDKVPLPRGVKFKTTFIITKKAFLSASAHLTLIIASFQGEEGH